MNSKAEYFDSQIESEWANKEYKQEDLDKISRMLRLAQWRPDMGILEPGCGTGRLTEVLADLSENRRRASDTAEENFGPGPGAGRSRSAGRLAARTGD